MNVASKTSHGDRAPTAASSESNASGTESRPFILFVDDRGADVVLLYEMLKLDYDVCAATSGETALRLCANRPPELIVLDVNLSDMDGHEVCRRIKEERTTCHIPIIFIAADADPRREARALDDGGADFIALPAHHSVVKARVRAQLARQREFETLRSSASTDVLTGIANRRRLDDALAREWRRAQRDDAPISLLMIDVDRFKAFNDTYGHPAGDFCLKEIAAAVKRTARRPGDIAGRYGGEEFAVVLPGADAHFAARAAEAVRASIVGLALPHIGNGSCGGVVTVSVGVATHRPREQFAGNGQDQLVQTADDMLYEAKRLGRNRVMTLQARPTDPVAPVPADENERIAAVEEFGRLLDGERAAYLDNVAQLAASLLGAPIGLVSLVGRDEQVFVGRYGLDDDGTPRDVSFCAHAMSGERILVVPDATIDPRFKDNALVTGSLGIRFYAGAPLKSLGGGPSLGALCVIDQTARPALTPQQQGQLLLLSTLAMGYIDSLGDRRPGPDLARA